MRAGDLNTAEKIARAITYTLSMDGALNIVARAFANAGDRIRAENVALSINDPPFRRRRLLCCPHTSRRRKPVLSLRVH